MIRTRDSERKGTVVVVVAVCLVAMLGITALAVDGGMLLDERRQLQAVADAAALSAVDELYNRWYSYYGLDTNGAAATAAQATAAINGYTNGTNCTVTVNIPPLSGDWVGKPGHAEVIVTVDQPRFFSRIWGTTPTKVGARAVARGQRWQFKQAILVLDPSSQGSLNANGGGAITITGAPIQVNSNNAAAMVGNGGGSLSAPEFDVTGSPGWSTPGGGSFSGTIVPNSPPIPDPYANLPVPDPSTMTVRSNNKTQISGHNTTNLLPGVYKGGITINGGTVNMAPGIYYMQGGGFSTGGNMQAPNATGVMIYNAPTSNSDTISISGSGNITMSPPTTGPYQGFTLFQDRTSADAIDVTGNGGMNITGTFYAAGAVVKTSGNGDTSIGSQYISYQLQTGGNGATNINWTSDSTPAIRLILLVE